MTKITLCHMIEQNQYGVVQRGPNAAQHGPLHLGTVGCAMCVGVALWRACDGKALLAHIEPEQHLVHKVRDAVAKIHQLLPNPSKIEIATGGLDEHTDRIIRILKSQFDMPFIEHFGRDEISINAVTGVVRASCSGHRPTPEARPDDLLIEQLGPEHQTS